MAIKGKSWKHYFIHLIINTIGQGVLRMPYHWRVPMMGWMVARVFGPLAGYRKRIRKHLAYACPNLDKREAKRLCYLVPNNAGRSLIELYSGSDFSNRVGTTPVEGAGATALAEAHKAGRPVVLVTAHFGNYDAARVALLGLGYKIGALYMPMKNLYFNTHYEQVMAQMGGELFPRGRKGMARLVKFLRAGGMTFFVADRYEQDGADLRFFNKSAPTALSAANMALKYDALLLPIYGIRAENGLDFKVLTDTPIMHSDAETMTQALNDSLEALVRQHMGQWWWVHRRWRPEGQRKRAAAKIGP